MYDLEAYHGEKNEKQETKKKARLRNSRVKFVRKEEVTTHEG